VPESGNRYVTGASGIRYAAAICSHYGCVKGRAKQEQSARPGLGIQVGKDRSFVYAARRDFTRKSAGTRSLMALATSSRRRARARHHATTLRLVPTEGGAESDQATCRQSGIAGRR
jgi:hypothetical protein